MSDDQEWSFEFELAMNFIEEIGFATGNVMSVTIDSSGVRVVTRDQTERGPVETTHTIGRFA